jgi:ElaB/YqjD/DUF883 family membrane-anchored ribosome-binding protein
MGIYGNSGCSSQCDLDKDIFGHHLLKYLNANKQTIMLAIADQIEKEAGELKAKAQEELKKAMDELESVDKQEKQ